MTGPLTTKSRALIAIVVITAAAFFALGLLAAGLFERGGDAQNPGDHAPTAAPRLTLEMPTSGAGGPSVFAEGDAGGPTILFDPSSINLLPDASLRLDLPDDLDGGLPP